MREFSKKSIAIMLITVIVAMIPICVYAASNTLKRPSIKSISVSGRQVTVKYGKVKKATAYVVYRVTKNKKGKNVYTKVASSKTNIARFMGKYNTTYKLAVKAFRGKKSSKYSAAKSKKIGKSLYTYVFFGSDSRWNGKGWEKVKASGNKGTNGEPRSDVIMLLKLNSAKKTVDIVSIYRDTLVNIHKGSGTNLEKVNRAYAKYGPAEATKVLEKNLDISLDGYIATNFKGVADAIDKMGGIKLKIEKDKVSDSWQKKYGYKTVPDVMNMYIDEQNRIYGEEYGEETKHVNNSNMASAKKLSGFQAVAYARVRYTDGGDFRRAKRQRAVLQAMVKKFQSIKSAKKKLDVLKSIYPTVDTNLSSAQLLSLLKKVQNYSVGKQMGYAYYKKSGYLKLKEEYQTEGREYVLIPTDTKKNVITLHRNLYGEIVYKPSKQVNKNSTIISKTKIYNKQTGGAVINVTYRYRFKNWDNLYDKK